MNYFKVFKNLIIVSFIFILTGCPVAPHSRLYKTMDWEANLFDKSTRCVFPDDLRINTEKYIESKERLNWVGIIKNVESKMILDTGFLEITLEQKYWDYVEDFSIQDEQMFVSQYGEGEFVYIKKSLNTTQGKLDTMKMSVNIDDLGICYGNFTGLSENIPIIEGEGIRFIPYFYYTTKVMSYRVAKDSLTGLTVCDENNFFEMTDFEFLKIAGPGQNK